MQIDRFIKVSIEASPATLKKIFQEVKYQKYALLIIGLPLEYITCITVMHPCELLPDFLTPVPSLFDYRLPTCDTSFLKVTNNFSFPLTIQTFSFYR